MDKKKKIRIGLLIVALAIASGVAALFITKTPWPFKGDDTQLTSRTCSDYTTRDMCIGNSLCRWYANTEQGVCLRKYDVNHDTSQPTINIIEPVDNSSVSGTVRILTQISDGTAVMGVNFDLPGDDNDQLFNEIYHYEPNSFGTYEYLWNTASLENGLYPIKITAYDSNSFSGTDVQPAEKEITVRVNNLLQVFTVPLAPQPTITMGTQAGTTDTTRTTTRNSGTNLLTLPTTSRTAVGGLTDTNLRGTTGSGATAGTPDTTSPTVTITSPHAGDPVSGTVTITATATAFGGRRITQVTFKTGETAPSFDLVSSTTSPYGAKWNTSSLTDGQYKIFAYATDNAGNRTPTPSQITVNVNNSTAGADSDAGTGGLLTDDGPLSHFGKSPISGFGLTPPSSERPPADEDGGPPPSDESPDSSTSCGELLKYGACNARTTDCKWVGMLGRTSTGTCVNKSTTDLPHLTITTSLPSSMTKEIPIAAPSRRNILAINLAAQNLDQIYYLRQLQLIPGTSTEDIANPISLSKLTLPELSFPMVAGRPTVTTEIEVKKDSDGKITIKFLEENSTSKLTANRTFVLSMAVDADTSDIGKTLKYIVDSATTYPELTLNTSIDNRASPLFSIVAGGASLTLIKNVVNDNGGTATVADFPLFISGTSAVSGTAYTLTPGTYTASETNKTGYVAGSWGRDCAPGGTITLAAGDNKICTITNDDITTTTPPTCPTDTAPTDNNCVCPSGTEKFAYPTFYWPSVCIPCTVAQLLSAEGYYCPQHKPAVPQQPQPQPTPTPQPVTFYLPQAPSSTEKTCEQRGQYTYTGPPKTGVRIYGMCIDCSTDTYIANGGQCAAVAAKKQTTAKQTPTPTADQNQAQQFAATDQTPQYAARAAAPTPDLSGSQRLVRAPERGNAGPETALYLAVMALVQGGVWIGRKIRRK